MKTRETADNAIHIKRAPKITNDKGCDYIASEDSVRKRIRKKIKDKTQKITEKKPPKNDTGAQ